MGITRQVFGVLKCYLKQGGETKTAGGTTCWLVQIILSLGQLSEYEKPSSLFRITKRQPTGRVSNLRLSGATPLREFWRNVETFRSESWSRHEADMAARVVIRSPRGLLVGLNVSNTWVQNQTGYPKKQSATIHRQRGGPAKLGTAS
jgi:hypothetical protein